MFRSTFCILACDVDSRSTNRKSIQQNFTKQHVCYIGSHRDVKVTSTYYVGTCSPMPSFLLLQMYQRNCENPPVHRDFPPISGRISWARQLMRRIRNPMDIFERHPSCLKTQEAIKIICHFNQLATVLVEFEILYHKGWLKQVEIAKTGMYYALWLLRTCDLCSATRCAESCYRLQICRVL